jgi:hypothetical protein
MELEKGKGTSAYGAFLVVIVVIFVLFAIIFGVRPLYQSYKELSVKQAQTQARLMDLTEKAKVLEEAEKNQESLELLEEYIAVVAPKKDDRPDTYWQFELISLGSGAFLGEVKEGEYLVNSSIYNDFSEQSFRLGAASNYDSMLKYLKALENATRLFNIKKISLSPSSDVIKMDLDIVTYYANFTKED